MGRRPSSSPSSATWSAFRIGERGLLNATQQDRVQLSVVACDLRGFTAFSETAGPEEVMQLLQQYYDAIGEVVAECGGTIKDFAGDGSPSSGHRFRIQTTPNAPSRWPSRCGSVLAHCQPQVGSEPQSCNWASRTWDTRSK